MSLREQPEHISDSPVEQDVPALAAGASAEPYPEGYEHQAPPDTATGDHIAADSLAATGDQAEGVVGLADFERIYSQFRVLLISLTLRLIDSPEEAADLTQDTFEKAYRALAGGATIPSGALRTWLKRIALNTTTDALRRRKAITWLPLLDGIDADQPPSPNAALGESPERLVAQRELIAIALGGLQAGYRTCLVLYEHFGYTPEEIAEMVGISYAAVKMRLMRARAAFREIYYQAANGDPIIEPPTSRQAYLRRLERSRSLGDNLDDSNA